MAHTEAYGALRTGSATDVTAVIGELQDPGLKGRLTSDQLAAFLLGDQKAKLKKLLRATPSVTLLNPGCLPVSLAAWRALDMKEAVKLAEARLKTSARTIAETAWSTRDVYSLLTLVHLAVQTGDASLIPPGLEEDLGRWMAEPRDLLQFRFYLAFAREDWETCARLGEEAIRNQPSEYPLYFLVGKACAKRGLADRAVPLLTTYLEKAHNEIQVPEAKALLKSLRP